MSEVPKFVRQRLQHQAAGEHPDANLLAAFAEGALTERERARVVGHLAACVACREAVSLALPEVPATTTVAVPTETKWSRWPMLRWAGVAAAVVVVAVAVLVQNSRHAESPAQFMRTETTTKPAATKQPETPAPGPLPEVVMNDRVDKESRKDKDTSKAGIRTEKKKDAPGGMLASANSAQALQEDRPAQSNNQSAQSQQHGANAKALRQVTPQNSANMRGNVVGGVVAMEQNQQPVTAPPQRPQSANETVEVVADAGALDVQNSQAQSNTRSGTDSSKSYGAKSEVSGRATASARKPAAVAGSMAAAGGAEPKSMMKTAMVVSPQWRLSSEGALERSTDAGNTWHFVEVAARPLKLRSFSTVGAEIWAGGTGGALYHSGDGGRTWARVQVKAGDAALGSDIVRVEFFDARRGALKTASGETWTTNDAGATWSVHR